jgi:hypothetical protein
VFSDETFNLEIGDGKGKNPAVRQKPARAPKSTAPSPRCWTAGGSVSGGG